MCDPSTLAMAVGGLNAYDAYSKAQAEKDQANFQSDVARNNAKIESYKSKDAINRGQQAVQDNMLATAEKSGSATASAAARGLDLGTGSALNILEDIGYMGKVDQSRLTDNASREAWGYNVQGMNFKAESGLYKAKANSINPAMAAASSLLNSSANYAKAAG